MLLACLPVLTGCGRGLPPEEEPDARREEVLRRAEAAPYPAKGNKWLLFIADDGTPETRDLLIERLNEFGAASHVSAALLRQYWREDERARQALAAYYTNPMRSRYDRWIAHMVAIRNYKDRYEEFRGLPASPPVPEGIPRIAEPDTTP